MTILNSNACVVANFVHPGKAKSECISSVWLFGCFLSHLDVFFRRSQKPKNRSYERGDSDESDYMEGKENKKVRGKRHDDSDDSDIATISQVSSSLPNCDTRNISTSHIISFLLRRGKH